MRRSFPPLFVAAAIFLMVPMSSSFGVFVSSIPTVSGSPDFVQGTVNFKTPGQSYGNPLAALGQPSRISGISDSWLGPVTAFNPAYEENELVDLGVGGHITLQLPEPIVVAGRLQIGIFTTAALNDPTYSGRAEKPARTFAFTEYGAERSAVVEVAASSGQFVSLGRVIFSTPTQGYANQSTPYDFPDPLMPSDFDKPFAGGVSALDGLFSGQISTLLDGSAGGTWLAVPESASLSDIQFIRISDPLWRLADGSTANSLPSRYYNDPIFYKSADLFIDGVNVVSVPEPASGILLISMLSFMARRRRA